MSQTAHDELAQLFARNMNFTQPNPSTPDQQFPFQQLNKEPMTFITQHYTGHYHIVPKAASEPATSPQPVHAEFGALESTLRQHDIDPISLSPSQAQLFRNADYAQRLRLLELWHVSQTSLVQEEEMARARYERRMHERDDLTSQHEIAMDGLDSTAPQPHFPPPARARAGSILSQTNGASNPTNNETEPYMASGYEMLARRDYEQQAQARVDPVYAASTGLWQAPSHAEEMQKKMEDAYGAYQQARHFEHLQSLNREVEMNRFMGVHGPLDDDMVM
ncbi:hypothetical protein H2203_004108 [Taxawa tesnikishii (nom. ined.)]|nr:hypothetical protein H2203_004108 [Dothideales sp. JES 119]